MSIGSAATHQTLQIALQHHQSGNLRQAEALYRQILAVEPRHAEAIHSLGVLAKQTGHDDAAVKLFTQALQLKPDFPEALSNLGMTFTDAGRLDEAIQCLRQALAINPRFAEAHDNLGSALAEKGDRDGAIASYREALMLKPDFAHAQGALGNLLCEKGQTDEAIDCYRKALSLQPDFPEVLNNLGSVLKETKGSVEEAIDYFRKALALKPDFPDACCNLAKALRERGQLVEAVAYCRKAITLNPDLSDAHAILGNAMKDMGRLDDAVTCYQRAIALKPDSSVIFRNLGITLTEMGQLDDALQCFRRAIDLNPDFAVAHSYLLLFLNCLPQSTPQDILQESLRWDLRHAEPLRHLIQPNLNNRNPDRPLRIGYVSPDFREHAVGRFLLPLLANIDRNQFATFCYASVREPDAMTARLKAHADLWRDIVAMTDEQTAELIRSDGIDILVDLSVHTVNHRLLVFARKPAPVQVTYLAYCSTTGLAAMDYRITDPYLDPPGVNDSYYSEQSIHLPQTYWCYQPGAEVDEPNPLPALSAGHITFGSLNNFCKLTQPALEVWCRLLQSIPHSELILHSREGSHRQRLLDFLAGKGIDPRRLRFVSHLPIAQYFAIYQNIDIALDSFPCTGGTTTCDALWMGVPVVSLAGQAAVARGGASILANLGLPELVARTTEEYLKIAADLAADLPRLAQLRATLRQRMKSSPLMDAARFSQSMEEAYRTMWRNWCENAGTTPNEPRNLHSPDGPNIQNNLGHDR